MVPAPTFAGTFDSTLSPVVTICDWDGDACADGPPVAEFTTTTGPGSETVRVSLVDEHYHVNWHTDLFSLSTEKTYRIQVRVGERELGFADVKVGATGRDLKNIDTGEFVALKDGRTLPIKFRIEEGALGCGPIVTFPDAGLEAAVRAALGSPTGDLTAEQVAGITNLQAQFKEIVNLQGLECLTGLTILNLNYNKGIQDFSPLESLPKLGKLWLDSTALTDSDLSVIGSLSTLSTLSMKFNTSITDISPLAGLTSLGVLDLSGASVGDLTPLQGLTGLWSLTLNGNPVGDEDTIILTNLTNLIALGLEQTQITNLGFVKYADENVALLKLQSVILNRTVMLTDISDLLDLPALKSVSIYQSSITCDHPVIMTLLAREPPVTVSPTCPPAG